MKGNRAEASPPPPCDCGMRDETPGGLPSVGWPRGLGPASPVGTGTARYVSRCPPGLGTGSSLVHPGPCRLRRRSQIRPRGGRGRSCPSAERPRAPKGPAEPPSAGRSGFTPGSPQILLPNTSMATFPRWQSGAGWGLQENERERRAEGARKVSLAF